MLKYAKPPITEAIIEIRTRPAPGISAGDLTSVGKDTAEGDQLIPLHESTFQIEVGSGSPSAERTDFHQGYALKSEHRVIQWRVDRFAFSRLAPYGDWESFRHDARTAWERFRDATRPESVTRIGLRYINRFDIPAPSIELLDYFPGAPDIPKGIPQVCSGFFSQILVPYSDIRSLLTLTHTMVPPPQMGLVSIVLDIDLGSSNNLPTDEEARWQLLDQLRMAKNDIFEACITDAARELIR